MTSDPFDPAPAARRLAPYWQGWQQTEALPEAERPRDLAEGYQLQRRLISELGEPVAGYKVGLSSTAAMQRSGLGEPIFGFVPKSRLHRSGSVVPVPPAVGMLIEVEIAFGLPGDLNSEPSAHLAFEIVRGRFVEPKSAGMPSFIGDGSGLGALVVGDPIPIAELPSLLRAGAVLKRDGELVSGALAGAECPDPPAVLERFRSLAARHDMPLAPGMIIATGSIVSPCETPTPGVYSAHLGPYTATFIGRDPR